MAYVRFSDYHGKYVTEVPSDSDPNTFYTVTYDPTNGEFECFCPSFTYSRVKTCKHVQRYGNELTDYVDELDRLRPQPKPEPELDVQDEFNVILNDGPEKVLDRSTVEWLLSAINSGDELTIQLR